jgi:hypothetical protein
MTFARVTFALGVLVAFACSLSQDGPATTTPPGNVVPDPVGLPQAVPAEVDPNPTAPKDDAGHDLGWSQAPLMQGVLVAPNRDSVIVVVPAVTGAVD